MPPVPPFGTDTNDSDISNTRMYYALQVLEIIQTHTSIDLFNPELEKEKQKRTTDPVTTDLLGALLSVSTILIILESIFEVYQFDFNFY